MIVVSKSILSRVARRTNSRSKAYMTKHEAYRKFAWIGRKITCMSQKLEYEKKIFCNEKKINLDGPECLYNLHKVSEIFKKLQQGESSLIVCAFFLIWWVFFNKSALCFPLTELSYLSYQDLLQNNLLPFIVVVVNLSGYFIRTLHPSTWKIALGYDFPI